jgi:hypothetical protein
VRTLKRGAGGDEQNIAHVLPARQHGVDRDAALLMPQREHHRKFARTGAQFANQIGLPVAKKQRLQHLQIARMARADLPAPFREQPPATSAASRSAFSKGARKAQFVSASTTDRVKMLRAGAV